MTETSLGIRLLFSCFDAGTGREACVSGSYGEYEARCAAAGKDPTLSPDMFRQMHDWDYTKRDEACFKEMLRERGYGPEVLT